MSSLFNTLFSSSPYGELNPELPKIIRFSVFLTWCLLKTFLTIVVLIFVLMFMKVAKLSNDSIGLIICHILAVVAMWLDYKKPLSLLFSFATITLLIAMLGYYTWNIGGEKISAVFLFLIAGAIFLTGLWTYREARHEYRKSPHPDVNEKKHKETVVPVMDASFYNPSDELNQKSSKLPLKAICGSMLLLWNIFKILLTGIISLPVLISIFTAKLNILTYISLLMVSIMWFYSKPLFWKILFSVMLLGFLYFGYRTYVIG